MTDTDARQSRREVQRLETRQRILDAAIAEFKRTGMADADVRDIVAAAGVAIGTFYFHFPTKEHVLEEVEGNLVVRLDSELERFLRTDRDLWAVLSEIVRLVVASETRMGTKLFRDVLAMHFSVSRPPGYTQPVEHPLVSRLSRQIERAQANGHVHHDVEAMQSALFFLLGLYSLLVTSHQPKAARAQLLETFVLSTRRGLEAR